MNRHVPEDTKGHEADDEVKPPSPSMRARLVLANEINRRRTMLLERMAADAAEETADEADFLTPSERGYTRLGRANIRAAVASSFATMSTDMTPVIEQQTEKGWQRLLEMQKAHRASQDRKTNRQRKKH